MTYPLIVIIIITALLLFAYLLRRRQPSEHWSGFSSETDYLIFIEKVQQFFREQNTEVTIVDGMVTFPGNPKNAMGLQNLVQICNQSKKSEWDKLISDHFNLMEKAEQERDDLEKNLHSFDLVKDKLATRLYPADYVDAVGPTNLICRQELKGTISALVFDLEHSSQTVKPEVAKKWGKSERELLEIGLKKVKNDYSVKVNKETVAENFSIFTFVADHFYSSTHALLLEDYPEAIGEYGALVGVPHRHTMLTYPINDNQVFEVVQLLIPIIFNLEKQGPGSLSPYLYWYHNQEFTQLPYRINNRTLEFIPPDEFVEFLETFPSPKTKKGMMQEG